MTDADLDVLYKSALTASHLAALRAVFEAGAGSVAVQDNGMGEGPLPPPESP